MAKREPIIIDGKAVTMPTNGTDTSDAAAASAAERATIDRVRVLEHIDGLGRFGATCDEIEVILGLSHQTASARLWQLRTQTRQIIDSGLRRRTRSGKRARVYVLAEVAEKMRGELVARVQS